MNLPCLDTGPSLTERTYEAILEAVQSLALAPGKCVSVQDLASQLGVSRTPISAALQRLEQDGLVSGVPYKGVCITPISARDVKEILGLRILLESYAAGEAAGRLSPDELAQAEEILQQMERAHAEERRLESANTGHQFHQLLLSKVDNQRLVGILHQLDTQYGRIRRYSAAQGEQGARSIAQHEEILKALQAGDSEGAAQAMADHLASVRENILSTLFPDGKGEGQSSQGEVYAAEFS